MRTVEDIATILADEISILQGYYLDVGDYNVEIEGSCTIDTLALVKKLQALGIIESSETE